MSGMNMGQQELTKHGKLVDVSAKRLVCTMNMLIFLKKHSVSIKMPICGENPWKGCLQYVTMFMNILESRQRPLWGKGGADLMPPFIIFLSSSCFCGWNDSKNEDTAENWGLCSRLLSWPTFEELLVQSPTTDKSVETRNWTEAQEALVPVAISSLKAPTPVSVEHSWNIRASFQQTFQGSTMYTASLLQATALLRARRGALFMAFIISKSFYVIDCKDGLTSTSKSARKQVS